MWNEVHQVSSEAEMKLKIQYYLPRANAKMPVTERTVTFETRAQRDLFVIVFRRLCRDAWQQFYESKWIKAPEIYQLHRACLRYNNKGRRSPAVVALSNTKMYILNPEKGSLFSSELSGSCALKEINAVASHTNCDTLVTVTGPSSIVSGTGKINVDILLRFFTVEDTQWL